MSIVPNECEEVCEPVVEYKYENHKPIKRLWHDEFDSDSNSYW